MKKGSIQQSLAKGGAVSLMSFFLFASVVPSALAAPTTPAVPGNLILNPQMQSATVSSSTPDDWFQGGYGTSTTTYAYPVAGPESGDLGAQVTVSNYTDGAAEWYFQNVAVTGNALYTFSDDYNSNVETYLIAEWTLSDGTLEYDAVATLPSTNGAWVATPQETFPAPANAVSVTVLHLIQNGNGTLTTANYALTPYTPTTTGQFPKGIVTLTFDDGWASQFDNARPILKAAGIPGTFYIITDLTQDATDADSGNLLDASDISTSTQTATGEVSFGNIANIPDDGAIYTDPTYQQYTFNDTYTATTTSTVTVNYCTATTLINNSCPAASIQSMVLGTDPAGTNAPASFSFLLPTVASSTDTVTPISITQSVPGDEVITTSDPSLVEYQQYMTASQLLALQSDGDEIDSHTETHPDLDLTTLTTAEATAEINGSRAALLGWGATPANGFAYPFGDYNTTVEGDVAGAGYTNARTVDVGFNTENSDPLLLKSESAVASTTFPTIQSWIDDAIANKWWLVITLHDIDPANVIAENDEVYGITPDMLQQIVSYLKTQEDAGNVQVGTMDQEAALVTGTSPVTPITTPTTTPATSTPEVDIIPGTLADGTVGTAYSQQFSASTTATGQFTWSVSSGALPDGLSFDATTTSITGTPTTAGTYSFGLSTSNGTSATTQSYSLTIDPAAAASGGGSSSGGGGGGGGGSTIASGNGLSHGGAPATTTPATTTPSTGTTTPSTGEVLGASTYNFTRNLSLGMSGPDVTALQQILITLGDLKIPSPTGYFGQLTKAAVKLYQKANGIPQTGNVGPLTRAALNAGTIPTTPETTGTTTGTTAVSLTVSNLQSQLNALIAELAGLKITA